MVTLAICWQAIGVVILICAAIIGFIALVDWITDLTVSYVKWKRILGWSLVALIILGLLIWLYFLLATSMCG